MNRAMFWIVHRSCAPPHACPLVCMHDPCNYDSSKHKRLRTAHACCLPSRGVQDLDNRLRMPRDMENGRPYATRTKRSCLGLSVTDKPHNKQSTPNKGSSMLQCRKATRALPVLHHVPQNEVAQVKTPQKQIPIRELSGMVQRAKMLCWPPPRVVHLSDGSTFPPAMSCPSYTGSWFLPPVCCRKILQKVPGSYPLSAAERILFLFPQVR
jgi:hypothetical protein